MNGESNLFNRRRPGRTWAVDRLSRIRPLSVRQALRGRRLDVFGGLRAKALEKENRGNRVCAERLSIGRLRKNGGRRSRRRGLASRDRAVLRSQRTAEAH